MFWASLKRCDWRKPKTRLPPNYVERWWMEHVPVKNDYKLQTHKSLWGKFAKTADLNFRFYPSGIKRKYTRREDLRHLYIKQGIQLSTPKWGG